MIASKPKVLRKIFERQQELAAIGKGLTEEVIENAIRQSETERDSCTAHDPNCLPGILAWGRCNRFLRDQLVLVKWHANDDRNYPTVVSPDGTRAIAVATGDEGTGQADKHPGTKFPKGIVTQDAVDGNVQALLFEIEPTEKKEQEPPRITWLLLKRRVNNTVEFELSLPNNISSDGIIKSYHKRIIFPSIMLESNVKVQDDTEEAVDIPVLRRQAQ